MSSRPHSLSAGLRPDDGGADAPLPAAVLWDLDGTLVDTEPLWIAAEIELVTSFGGTWTHQDALALVGNDLLVSAEVLRAAGVDLPPSDIVERLVTRVNEQVRSQGPTWRPGALELLTQAHELGLGQAIVTMSYRRQAEVVAAALPPGTITAVIAGDMVTHGKPHPEAYLRAAEELGVPVGDCLAVEDSATGTAAALASGAATLAVPYLVAVPEHPALARVASLAGQDLRTLYALARDARDAGDHGAAPAAVTG